MAPLTATQRRGVWEPLSLMVYGYAIHPLTPTLRDTRVSGRTRLSTVTEGSADDQFINKDVVELNVGDEVYAFEQYVPKGKECEGIWYRGYVVTSRRPDVQWNIEPSSSQPKASNAEETIQVFLGIFPASHIHVRSELPDVEGRLGGVIAAASDGATPSAIETQVPWIRERLLSSATSPHHAREDAEAGPRHGSSNVSSSRPRLPGYPLSSRSGSPSSQALPPKPHPPKPQLKSNDDTEAGMEQPIVDEIASALREWYTLMYVYLARRDYKLFHAVRDHMEALHLGRRQLLAQTLSLEETTHLRRDCVARLVSGNIVQGLDIIVRHPDWGSLVTVDVEQEVDLRSWLSAVRMYAMQVSLAYMDISTDSLMTKAPALGLAANYSTIGPIGPLIGAPPSSAFHDVYRPREYTRLLGSLAPPGSKSSVKFYHVFLDLKAFVASPCSPGETAELYFSLYNSADMRFVTEEFCAILNHNGVLARDPTARIRTLFTDLVQSEAKESIYLVCKIVRNGALKIGANMSSSVPVDAPRRQSESSGLGWNDSFTGSNGYSSTPLPGAGRSNTPTDHSAHFRRPFGCAVLQLTQLNQFATDHSESSATREHTMPIYTPTNEAMFSVLHQEIIARNTKEFEKSPRAEMLAVSIKVFHGDTKTIIRENPSLLQETPQTLRLSFPDVVFPEDTRNEMYIKVWSGEFISSYGSGRLSVANITRVQMGPQTHNVQITVEVRDENGRTLEKAIHQGSGEPPVTYYHSMVFARNNVPTFGELLKLQLPTDGPPTWHLFFTFRHRSQREKYNPRQGNDPSERPFGFAFLPLYPENQGFLEDKSHTLVVYRANTLHQLNVDAYLNLPWNALRTPLAIPQELSRIAQPLRDNLVVRSSLCSTKFTQNIDLLNLLNWEQIKDKEVISRVLSKFAFTSEIEITKFLRNIFDSLFGILLSSINQTGEMDDLVFNALVWVLGIIQDRRFNNFQPVLDVYIEKHFNSPSAYTHIIRSLNRLLADPASTSNGMNLRAALKVWQYILKFIVRSRELQKSREAGIGSGTAADHLESSFKKDLRSHLSEVNRMMETSSPALIGTQTIALQNFTSILPDLDKVFSTIELVSLVRGFAKSVVTAKGKIVIWKLIMYLQVVKGFLFDNSQSRTLIVEAVVSWIKPHFGRYDEYAQTQVGDNDSTKDNARIAWLESSRLCVTIIAVMLDRLQRNLVNPAIAADRGLLRQEQDNVEYLLSLFPRLLDTYREYQHPASLKALEKTRTDSNQVAPVPISFPETYPFSLLAHLPSGRRDDSPQNDTQASETQLYNCGLSETAVVFLVLILSSSKENLLSTLETTLEIEGSDRFTHLLSQLFKVATSILNNDAWPPSWLNIDILAHQVLIKLATPISMLLEQHFVPERNSASEFKADLWHEALYMLLKLLSSEQLVIEEHNPQKSRAVWRLAADIRGEGAEIIVRLWEALAWPDQQTDTETGQVIRYGGYQETLDSLAGLVVNLCLSHHDQLRTNAVRILFNMIISDYVITGNFEHIENELVNKLDDLFMSNGKGDDISRVYFIGHLRGLFVTEVPDPQLVDRVQHFLDSVDIFLELLLSIRELPDGEEYMDDRVYVTLRLMNFLRRTGRDEMYIKYVHQLVNMHLQSQNYVEAALTLKLHSDLHEWNTTSFVEPLEDLGLPRQTQFQRKETICLLILDYLGKGKAWESAIEICRELASQHSELTFNYSRLSEILRHEAALYDRIITDTRYYPDYFRVTFYGAFHPSIRNKQHIYRGLEWEKFGAFCERILSRYPGAALLKDDGDAPVDIRFGDSLYIQCNPVSPEPNKSLPVFTNPDVPAPIQRYYEHSALNLFSYQRPVVKLGPNGEEEIWTIKTYITTMDSFPTFLRRSEVSETRVFELSPSENALADVDQKTKDLSVVMLRYTTMVKTGQPITTNSLSSALNAAVDGTVTDGILSYRQTFFSPDYINGHPDQAEIIDKLRDAIDEYVYVIFECLKLHLSLCSQESLISHEALEKAFRKKFKEEIQRLSLDMSSIIATVPISPASKTSLNLGSTIQRTQSVSSDTSTRRGIPLAPLQLGRTGGTLPVVNSEVTLGERPPLGRQTLLQRNLAHLARHGITGVSSGPGDAGAESTSGSPPASFVNMGSVNGAPGTSASTLLSGSGSIRGRFSRFGSLNFKTRKSRE